MINAIDIAMFDSEHSAKIGEHVTRLRENGIEERILFPEGTKLKDLTKDWGPPEWHRTLSRDLLSNATPSFVFGDCYGIMLWEKQEIFIIRNRDLAEDQARKFTFLWEHARVLD
jgi:hypothetical protein